MLARSSVPSRRISKFFPFVYSQLSPDPEDAAETSQNQQKYGKHGKGSNAHGETETQTDDPASCLRPHDELWFDDGSVVLATDVHLYRVHKSMLAKHSTVLSDMFEIPSGNANTECWDGVPIVKMAGDSDEEVFILLKALYNRKCVLGVFFQKLSLTRKCLLPAFGIHSMEPSFRSFPPSAKYDFREIRADVMQFLESIFPNTYEKYRAAKQRALPWTLPSAVHITRCRSTV